MQLKRKLPWILTGKALLATGSIAMVALALVTYTATINISFSPFFTQGLATLAWSTTTPTGTRYLPGNTLQPQAPTLSNSSSYAFETITGKGYVSVGPGTVAKTQDFQSFKIFVLTWNATAWNNATLYTSTAFTTTVSGGIDGTNAASIGYLHINSATQVFFLIQVNYILVGSPVDTTASVVFNYTPSLN